MKRIIRIVQNAILERKWLKSKPCAACEHFDFYMGSAGVCAVKEGCPATRMRDYFDVCDCGRFKRKKRR